MEKDKDLQKLLRSEEREEKAKEKKEKKAKEAAVKEKEPKEKKAKEPKAAEPETTEPEEKKEPEVKATKTNVMTNLLAKVKKIKFREYGEKCIAFIKNLLS